MGIFNQETHQKFPFPFDKVYEGLLEILPPSGFRIKSDDKILGRITASTGMSFFSNGENIAIAVEKLDDSNTMLRLASTGKFGGNLTGKHQKNLEIIITALSKHLQTRAL